MTNEFRIPEYTGRDQYYVHDEPYCTYEYKEVTPVPDKLAIRNLRFVALHLPRGRVLYDFQQHTFRLEPEPD